MTIDILHDQDYLFLETFFFSFDFPNKSLIRDQMHNAIVCKEQSAYHFAFSFEVREDTPLLPDACDGIPVLIQVKNPESLTLCEIFVRRNRVEEYRVYNIDNSKLDIKKLYEGTVLLEIRQDSMMVGLGSEHL